MNIHVDIVHPKLFAQGKVQLAKKQQWLMGKKRNGPIVVQSPTILGPQTCKQNDEAQHMFIEDLVFYTYKGYQKISNIENI